MSGSKNSLIGSGMRLNGNLDHDSSVEHGAMLIILACDRRCVVIVIAFAAYIMLFQILFTAYFSVCRMKIRHAGVFCSTSTPF